MDFTTDSILFLFLFILPGAFSKVLLYRFAPKRNNENDGRTAMMEISEIMVFSAVIFFFNILYFRYMDNIGNAAAILLRMQEDSFLLNYIALTLVLTTLCTCLLHIANKTVVLHLTNRYNRLRKKPYELEFPTVWENIFEGKDIIDFSNRPVVVGIEKNGILLTCGFLRLVPSPSTKCNELALVHTSQIREYFERDKASSPQHRIFSMIDVTYYNMEQDLVLHFYNMDQYNRYQEEINRSSQAEEGQASVL